MPVAMARFDLTEADNAELAPALSAIAERYASIEDPELLRRARTLSRVLPVHLVEFLEEHRLNEASALCLISGLEIDADTLGPTPPHWRDRLEGSATFGYEIFFLLASSVLGDAFGWATQQDGRIMHDVLPIEGHEHYELGSNSLQHLSWHTEDAFHPCRGDYVALMCLKNPDAVETVVCDAGALDLTGTDVEALFEAEFIQLPDNSHRAENGSSSTGDSTRDRLRRRSFDLIGEWNEHPQKRPVLFGDRQSPYLVLDPYHMLFDGCSPRARGAFVEFCAEIERCMQDVVLQPGDCVFIDNFRAVHGRKSFQARYDGSDRWLKRLNITRNLRGSRAWRPAPADRIIY